MIRTLTFIIIMTALLALTGMQGAGAEESDTIPDLTGDIVVVDIDINITDPLDDIAIINVTGEVNENISGIRDFLSGGQPPKSDELPENISFESGSDGLDGIVQGTTSGIRSSPSILMDGIGLGGSKAVEVIPEDTKESGKASISVVYSLMGEGRSRLISKMPAQQPSQPGSVKVSSNQFIATTMVGVIIMAFASVFSFKSQSNKVFPLFVPMYSRISRDEVLENETRGDIYRLIASSPGLDLLSIKNELGLSNGVLAHHIHTLEREKYLRSVRDGRYRRFFVNGTKVKVVNSIEEAILREIESHPSINQSAIARNLGISRQALNYHMRKLVKSGSVITEKAGRETLCRRRDS